ncbi:unnamed protein product [Colletotrichum noveboracense]|uniref:NAD-dependent epimerase/dehydratase domain-containing protein n=1 Tax=Colletotrichum noveboracense TaxID=2664923 RepID=A0A9W4W9X8_9PEZI|nr:unnamed protein product [Colletotrichum noveboracense]
MRVLITGAAGFIGQIVASKLLEDESNELIVTDVIEPPIPSSKSHNNVKLIKADLVDETTKVVPESLDAAMLLHGIMSSGAEANFELGYRVNVDATRSVLNLLAKRCPGVRVLYASSEAVYGRPVPAKNVTEDDIPSPEMSYGCQKVICETLINDYTRRSMINGFALRFPTISVRPGPPSAAVSSSLSGIELGVIGCLLQRHDNLMVALTLPKDALPPHRRAVNMPGFGVTVQDMLDALEEVGGKEKLLLVEEKDEPELRSLLYSWADHFDNSLAISLGMKQDTSFVQSARDYLETM